MEIERRHQIVGGVNVDFRVSQIRHPVLIVDITVVIFGHILIVIVVGFLQATIVTTTTTVDISIGQGIVVLEVIQVDGL